MTDTVAFVQEWLANADYDPTQFDKDFAAAIDARCKAASEDGTTGLRTALQEAHDTLHECTAVLTADDCRKVAGVMERCRAALAASPTDATGAGEHGLGPHALPIEDEPDGYDPVWYLKDDDIYLQQGKAQIFLSRKQAATLARNLPVAGETL